MAQIGYRAGLARKMGEDTTLYGLAGFRLTDEYRGNGYLGLSLEAGVIVDLPGRTRLLSEYHAEYLERSGQFEQRWILKVAHQVSRSLTVQLGLYHDDHDTLGRIGTSLHFD